MEFPMRLTAFTLSAVTVLAASPTFAASLSVEDLLHTYNGVTSGNFNSSQEVEGRLYVGGNLTGSTIQTGFVPLQPGPVQNVVVSGNTTIGTINGSGEIVIGGTANSNIEKNGATLKTLVGGTFSGNDNFGTVTSGLAGDPAFEAKFPEISFPALASYSAYLATLTGAIWTTPDQNNKALVSAPNAVQSEGMNWIAAKVTVLYTTLANLASGGLSVAGLDSDETIIVNVSGTSGTWGLNGLGDAKSGAKNILWNFYEAGSISVNSAIIGSVLAPNADMSGFSGSTEGSVIAKSISLTNGELHYQPFAGDLPEPPSVNPAPAPVPLPAALSLLLAALGGLAMVRRARA
jgi:choice-of-anchor A domain-containing protein